MREKKNILFIVCQGHSGSTLIGNMLGSLPGYLHLGEMVAPVKRNRPLVCRSCEPNPCPIWDYVIDKEVFKADVGAFIRYNSVSPMRKKLARLRRRPTQTFADIFAKVTELHTIVESSKSVPWIRYVMHNNPGYRYQFVTISRDLRAPLASYKRHHGSVSEGTVNTLVRKQEEMQALLAGIPAADVLALRYEEVVTDYPAFQKAVEDFLGLPSAAQMSGVFDQPHHLIGGNHGPLIQYRNAQNLSTDELNVLLSQPNKDYYGALPPKLILDERWKTELTAEELRMFDQKARPYNEAMGYAADFTISNPE